jgi:hypothetical protein
MAAYPFVHRTGLAIGHTFEVELANATQWQGYVLTEPMFESADFNPLGIDIGISDSVYFAQVVGLRSKELEFAVRFSGPVVEDRMKSLPAELGIAFLDSRRDDLHF